ncbi:hypothetical protein BTO05_01630 [Winogradskyella sp. PC-19]|uniref:sensor histidine kinase n=1 Tax=unclassified Winogradskyella TaxID=2615021 RepID=UPI000B3C7C55|nr:MULTISPECIES: triple tyrosine motif-containing protein [unclassified Winogradskyella]ARV08405.1 hypothetical protein BTO05_01630 [Winogradskyella sp. PC-19]
MKKYLLFLFLNLSLQTFGQSLDQFQKRTFSKDDGLKLDRVNSMCSDDDGFLWLGGMDNDIRTILSTSKELALLRFNGNTFQEITIPNLSKTTNEVSQLFKRKDGKILIVLNSESEEKIILFDPYSITFTYQKFEAYSHSKVFGYNGKNYVLAQNNKDISLYEITDNFTFNLIFKFTLDIPQQFVLDSGTELIFKESYCIISDNNFPIVFTDWKGQIFKQFKNDDFDRESDIARKKFWITKTFEYEGLNYAQVDSKDELYAIDFKTFDLKSTNPKLNTKNQLEVVVDKKGKHMMFSSFENTVIFQSVELDAIKTLYKDNTLKPVNTIEAYSNDLKQELWLFYNGNLHHYRFRNPSVTTYLKDYPIRAIKKKDTQNIIIATENNGWFNFNQESQVVEPLKLLENGKSISPRSTRNIIFDDSLIWSHSNGSFLKIDPLTFKSKSYRHYPIKNFRSLNDSIFVYATVGYNLMRFNKNTGEHSSIIKTDSLSVFDLVLQNNRILGATDKGILIYDLTNKKSWLQTDLKDNFVFVCAFDDQGNPLFGTRNGHIYTYDAKKNNFSIIYEDELNAGIAGVIVHKNTWWINTFNGVVAYNPLNRTTRRYSEKDGFSHYEGNRYSSLKTDDGIYFGTLSGVNFFNPDKLRPKEDNAQLTLLNTNYYNIETERFSDLSNRKILDEKDFIIELPTENRALSLDFALKNNIGLANDYFYRYRLNNNQWIDLKNQSFIQFPNLASGNYNLEIEALDYSGNKVGTSLIIPILSKEFFYKTWWFMVAISCLVIGVLLYFLRQFQLRKKLQDQFALDLIQSQEDERKRIASELHDSVSQQLTLIKRKAQNHNQEEISALTNNTLEEVRHISRGLFPPLLKQLGFTESIEQLAIDIDENNALFVSTDIENIDDNLTDEKALHLYRFVQECINNILKHAEAKALSITIEKEKDIILVLIKDNGKGFDVTSAKNKNSLGLKTLEERIKILNGELLIDSKIDGGTITKAKIRLS